MEINTTVNQFIGNVMKIESNMSKKVVIIVTIIKGNMSKKVVIIEINTTGNQFKRSVIIIIVKTRIMIIVVIIEGRIANPEPIDMNQNVFRVLNIFYPSINFAIISEIFSSSDCATWVTFSIIYVSCNKLQSLFICGNKIAPLNNKSDMDF